MPAVSFFLSPEPSAGHSSLGFLPSLGDGAFSSKEVFDFSPVPAFRGAVTSVVRSLAILSLLWFSEGTAPELTVLFSATYTSSVVVVLSVLSPELSGFGSFKRSRSAFPRTCRSRSLLFGEGVMPLRTDHA